MQPVEKHLFIFTSVMALCVDVSNLHPLLDAGSIPQDYDYLEGVKSEFQRDKDIIQKIQNSDLLSDGDVAQKYDSTKKGDVLPSDEQEECYRQQNIEPPPKFQKYHRSGESLKAEVDTVLAPISCHGSNCKTNQQRVVEIELSPPDYIQPVSSDHENDDLLRKSSENEQREHDDSHSKNEYKFEKKVPRSYLLEKSIPQAIEGERLVSKVNRKVYKPLQLDAEFPVYDEDIEFRPDPLHGLLDDKYWKNQEDKGDVIRNYIDLARNNMVPNGMDIVKRNIASEKSKFTDLGERCHCNQIVACKDCKKGKQEKMQEEKSTTMIARSSVNKERGSSSFNNNKELIEANSEYFSRKLMTIDYNNDGNETDSHFPTFINGYNSRKLLSLKDEVEHDIYDEEVKADSVMQENNFDRNTNNAMKSFEYSGKYEYNNYDSLEERAKDVHRPFKGGIRDDYGSFKERYSNVYDSFNTQSQIRTNNEITTEKYKYTNFLTFIDNSKYENSTHSGMLIFEMSSHYPGIYVPNKIGNMMQKTHHENQKKTTPSRKLELQTMKNETLDSVMLQPFLPYNYKNEKNRRQGNVEDYNFQKGRRSPVGPWPDIIFTPVGSTFQQESNDIKANSALSTIATNITSNRKSTIGTTSYPISTTQYPHQTERNQRKKHLKLSDYDNVDAKIANDIVETVMIESQKDAMLGHNLGLYRRKVSSKNVSNKAIPETEKIVGIVFECIMDKMKDHLAKQSCIILDAELLEFLKWLVLTGESYRDYSQKEKDFAIGIETVSHTSKTSSDAELEDTVNVGIGITSISSKSTGN